MPIKDTRQDSSRYGRPSTQLADVTRSKYNFPIVIRGGNFDEEAIQDIIGSILQSTDTIDLIYDDAAGTIYAVLKQQGATVGQVLQWNGVSWVPTTVSGGPIISSYTAATNLSASRCVVLITEQATYFDPTDPTHLGLPVGITTGAALLGSPVNVQFNGSYTGAALALTPNKPVFAIGSGILTTTTPVTDIIQPVGSSVTANTLIINIQTPIQLV